MHVTHFAFDFSLRYQCCHGVDDDHVNGVGTHQHVGDFQGLFAGVRLGNQQVVDVDAQLAGVLRVEGVFGVDEGAGGAVFLGFGDDRQGQRGLTRRFRAVDLDDTAFWQAADAQGDVQAQRAGGDGRDSLALVVAHAHDGALAELAFDLTQGRSQGALLVVVH
ncbi:hypothetical protein D3C72_1263870 [compost metagenome]